MSELRVTTLQHEAAAASNITLASNGNVGIGKSLPADKLHVSGESFPNIKIETNSASSGDSTLDLVGYRTTDSPVGYLKFWNNATSPTELARVTSYREGADNTGNLRFYTSSAGSLGERMRIDSAGRVTMPYQPAASASYNGADLGIGNLIPLNQVPTTRGGIVVGTNRFTVSVAGMYFVGYHHLAQASSTGISIRVNGANINSGAGSHTQSVAGAYNNFSAQNLVSMQANDFLDFYIVGGTLHGNGTYNRMYIYLLG